MLTLLHAGAVGHLHPSDFVVYGALIFCAAVSIWLQVRQ